MYEYACCSEFGAFPPMISRSTRLTIFEETYLDTRVFGCCIAQNLGWLSSNLQSVWETGTGTYSCRIDSRHSDATYRMLME